MLPVKAQPLVKAGSERFSRQTRIRPHQPTKVGSTNTLKKRWAFMVAVPVNAPLRDHRYREVR
jgi:hypothetical protein